MSLELGGLGAKDGIEFERLCALELAFQVIHGQATALSWERPGQEGRGVDFLVTLPDGSVEKRSCKISIGLRGSWSMAALDQEGVLRDARRHLQMNGRDLFVFVSRDAAPGLRALTDRAQRYRGDTAGFRASVEESGLDLRDELDRLWRAWELDSSMDPDWESGLSMLARTHVQRGPWGPDDQRRLQREAMAVANGDPSTILDEISGLIWGHRGSRIYADQIRSHLKSRGFRLADLSLETVTGAIERLRRYFQEALRPYLIADRFFRRAEVDRVLDWLQDQEGAPVAVLHGEAGVGKSAALLQLVDQADELGVPVLPIRLDMQRPERSLSEFSTARLELPSRDPVACLNALAGARTGLLLVDQLDAVRWTGQHAGEAVNICRELVQSARRYPRLRVLLVCRTFDLRDSKELGTVIQGRAGSTPPMEIELGPLPPDTLDQVFEALEIDSKKLDPEDRKLLSRGDVLAVWAELAKEGNAPLPVKSRSALFKEYWDRKPGQIAASHAVAEERLQAGLRKIVSYLDREGRLDAPANLLSDATARRALVSAAALREEAGRLAFVHQSHLDFLVAQRVYRKALDRGMSPLEWLCNHDQSLFRRRQLHLLLQLLRDGDPQRYAEALREILTAKGVRFHLKHLVFGLLHQDQTPTEAEVGVVLDLLEVPGMRQPLVDRSLVGSEGWFDALDRHGWIEASLRSGDDEVATDAIRLIRQAGPARVQRAETLLSPFLGSEDPKWQERVERSLLRHARDDTDVLFEWRLARVLNNSAFASDQTQAQLHWLTTESPKRAILLLGALLDRALSEIDRALNGIAVGEQFHLLSALRSELEKSAEGPRAQPKSRLETACSAEPALAWQELVPKLRLWSRRLELLSRLSRARFGQTRQPDDNLPRLRWGVRTTVAALHRLTSTAGRQLAEEEGLRFTKRLNRLNAQRAKAPWLAQLIAASLAGGGEELADWSLLWLLEEPGRVALGSSDPSKRKEQPARELIERFAGACSEDVFEKLETATLAYKTEYEKETVKRALKLINHDDVGGSHEAPLDPLADEDGFPRNRYGWAQYYLLSALPERRLSRYALSVLKTWKSKFGPVREARAEDRGARVASALDDVYARLSNRSWLQIMAGPHRRRWPSSVQRRRANPENLIIVNSSGTLSHSMEAAAAREPQRFAEFALEWPTGTQPDYLAGLLRSLGNTRPPHDPPSDWKPATTAQMEAVFERFKGSLHNGQVARSFCWLLSNWRRRAWSGETLRLLCDLAREHVDPGPEDNENLDGLNCVRGAAAHAIGHILLQQPDRLEETLPTLQRLVADPHAGVRTQTQYACEAIWRRDADLALRLYIESCSHEEAGALCSAQSVRLLSAFWKDHTQQVRPLAERLLNAEDDKARALGAELVTYCAYRGGVFEDLAERCSASGPTERAGAAKALGTVILEGPPDTGAAVRALSELFLDHEESVREAALSLFDDEGAFATPYVHTLLKEVVNSPSFRKARAELARRLAGENQPLKPFGPFLAEIARSYLDDSRAGQPQWGGEDLGEALLRLYDEGENDPGTRNLCLDAWDLLLESGAWGAEGMLSRYD